MRRFSLCLSSALAFLLIACGDEFRLSPITPSDTGTFDRNTAQDTIYKWSPYIGIHATGYALSAYRDALTLLKKTGTVKGVRVEILRREGLNNSVIRMISQLGGIDILGLIENGYLINNPNLERDIDQIFAAYPEIHYFQVGNEFTTIVSGNGGPMVTIEEYMASLKRIYNHVQNRYPGRAVLLTQSVLGSGLRGPTELEKMANLGLDQMDPNKIIIAINSYDPSNTSQYVGVLSGPLVGFRVWVTESGIRDTDLHISYVQNNFGKNGPFQNYLRAERIYWFVLWEGQEANSSLLDSDFGLIKDVGKYPDYWKSPLFKLLTESR